MAAMLEELNNKRYLRKIKFISQRKIILLFHSSNLANVNTLYVLSALRNKTASDLKTNLRISCVRDCRYPSGLAKNEYGDTDARISGGTDGPADGTYSGETSECICSTSWSNNRSSIFIAERIKSENYQREALLLTAFYTKPRREHLCTAFRPFRCTKYLSLNFYWVCFMFNVPIPVQPKCPHKII